MATVDEENAANKQKAISWARQANSGRTAYGFEANSSLQSEADRVRDQGGQFLNDLSTQGANDWEYYNKQGTQQQNTMNGSAARSLQSGQAAQAAAGAQGSYLNGQAMGARGQAEFYRGQAGQDYAAQGQARGSQGDVLNQLNQYAQQGPGPSVAQAQLAQSTDANMQSALALARSGRGAGENSAALRSAGFQRASAQQQGAGQAATLRATEAATARQQQLEALTQSGGLATNQRGQDISSMGQGLGAEQGYAGIGQNYDAASLDAMKMGQQTNLGYNQLAQGYQQTGAQAAQNYAQLGQQAQQQDITLGQNAYQYGESQRQQMIGQQMVTNANVLTGDKANASRERIASNAADTQERAALYSMGGAALGSLMGPIGTAIGTYAGKKLAEE